MVCCYSQMRQNISAIAKSKYLQKFHQETSRFCVNYRILYVTVKDPISLVWISVLNLKSGYRQVEMKAKDERSRLAQNCWSWSMKKEHLSCVVESFAYWNDAHYSTNVSDVSAFVGLPETCDYHFWFLVWLALLITPAEKWFFKSVNNTSFKYLVLRTDNYSTLLSKKFKVSLFSPDAMDDSRWTQKKIL